MVAANALEHSNVVAVAPWKMTPLSADPFAAGELPKTLADIVEFNAEHNGHHVAGVQVTRVAAVPGSANGTVDTSYTRFTHAQLHRGVLRAAAWLKAEGIADTARYCPPGTDAAGKDGADAIKPPALQRDAVSLFMSSDWVWTIVWFALMRLGAKTVTLSTRLSPLALANLLQQAGATHMLVTPSTRSAALVGLEELRGRPGASPDVGLYTPPQLADLLAEPGRSALDALVVPPKATEVEADDVTAHALHSSGTTGLPKPINHPHRFHLQQCLHHDFGDAETLEAELCLATVPMFHIIAQMTMGLMLVRGLPIVLPSPHAPPTADSVTDLLRDTRATALVTVPSLLTDMLNERGRDARELLPELSFVGFGGAPLGVSTGARLSEWGCRLLNISGTTETGLFVDFRRPARGRRWDASLLARDMPTLRLERVEGVGHAKAQNGVWQVHARPFGWSHDFVVQDLVELIEEDEEDEETMETTTEAGGPPRRLRWLRFLGRADSVVVLENGEKASPAALEEALRGHRAVLDVVTFGEGRRSLGVLVEVMDAALPGAPPEEADVERVRDLLWPAVVRGNQLTDAHAQLEREMMLVTTRRHKPLARTAKGTVDRRTTLELFQTDIDDLYASLEASGEAGAGGGTAPKVSATELDAVLPLVRRLVAQALGGTSPYADELEERHDLFEAGLDSLKVQRLVRSLRRHLRPSQPFAALRADAVYAHASVAGLAEHLVWLASSSATATATVGGGRVPPRQSETDRRARLDAMLQAKLRACSDWVATEHPPPVSIPPVEAPDSTASRGAVVLVTGGTGSLGCHLIASLLARAEVAKVVVLNRASRSQGSVWHRQLQALRARGLDAAPASEDDDREARLQVLEARLAEHHLGLSRDEYATLSSELTHVVHAAWPVDFLRGLGSFEAHVDGLARLACLARHATASSRLRGRPPCRLVFASTISTVHGIRDAAEVDEAIYEDADVVARMGYAESKHVGERLLAALLRHADGTLAPPTHAAPASTGTGTGTGTASWGELCSVRIGQLTGAARDALGAWNTSEWFPRLVKTSVAVGAFPILEGTHSWLPVDVAADCLVESLLGTEPLPPVFHLENPARQRYAETIETLRRLLHVARLLPYPEWARRVADVARSDDDDDDEEKGAAATMLELLESLSAARGPSSSSSKSEAAASTVVADVDPVRLSTRAGQRLCESLRSCRPVDEQGLTRLIEGWKRSGFL